MARASASRALVPVEEERRGWEESVAADVLPAGTSFVAAEFGGVPAEIVTRGGHAGGTILLFHGGGYNAGSPRTHRKFAARLAKATGWRVIVPDYHLAPEHPFPAGLEDAIAVYRRVRMEHGPLAVMGDSAGGGLATALLFEARRLRVEMPERMVLFSPQGDLTYSGSSIHTNAGYPNPSRADLERSAALYAGERDRKHPLLSPVFGDFSGFPPTLVFAGGREVLLDDAIRIVARAQEQGVTAQIRVGPGLWHAFVLFECPEADAALVEVAEFLRAS